MGIYNKFMLYFWLALSVLTTIFVTIMGIREGFDRWVLYYIFAFVGLMMYIVRRWMLKRMVKHMEFLEQQKNQQSNNV